MDLLDKQYILFLKSEPLDESQRKKVIEIGFQPLELKLMKFEYESYKENINSELSNLSSYDSMAFNSVNSVRSLSECVGEAKMEMFKDKRVFCVGQKTADLIQSQFNLLPQIIAKNQEELSIILKDQQIEGKCLYFIGTLSDLKENFKGEDSRLKIDECLSYGTKQVSSQELMQQIEDYHLNEGAQLFAVIYYSPSNTAFFFESLKQLQPGMEHKINIHQVKRHIAYGKKTLSELKKKGELFGISSENIKVCENPQFDDILKVIKDD